MKYLSLFYLRSTHSPRTIFQSKCDTEFANLAVTLTLRLRYQKMSFLSISIDLLHTVIIHSPGINVNN